MTKENSIKAKVEERFGKAKDPAFEFYPTDFHWETVDLSLEEVGSYVRIMCYQFSVGHFSLEDISKNCIITITSKIVNKLEIDEDGLYFLPFLERILYKRDLYKQTRSMNGKKGGAPKGNQNARKNEFVTEPQNNQKSTENQSNRDRDRGRDSYIGRTGDRTVKGGIVLKGFRTHTVVFDSVKNQIQCNNFNPLDTNRNYSQGIAKNDITSIKTALKEIVEESHSGMQIETARMLLEELQEGLNE